MPLKCELPQDPRTDSGQYRYMYGTLFFQSQDPEKPGRSKIPCTRAGSCSIMQARSPLRLGCALHARACRRALLFGSSGGCARSPGSCRPGVRQRCPPGDQVAVVVGASARRSGRASTMCSPCTWIIWLPAPCARRAPAPAPGWMAPRRPTTLGTTDAASRGGRSTVSPLAHATKDLPAPSMAVCGLRCPRRGCQVLQLEVRPVCRACLG